MKKKIFISLKAFGVGGKTILVFAFLSVFIAISLAGCDGTGDKPITSERTQSETRNLETEEAKDVGQTEVVDVEEKTETKNNAKAEITETNWEAYTDSIDTNWAIVTGVIKNTGDTNIRLDEASGSVYDANGKVVGNGQDFIYPRIISPNEEAYVAVDIMDTVEKSEIKDAKIQFSFEKTNEEPIKINAVNDSSQKGSFGEYNVTGELENPSDERIKDVRALVLFYDAEHNLINAEVAYPEPDAIPPHDSVSFKASTSDLVERIVDYEVIGCSMLWGF